LQTNKIINKGRKQAQKMKKKDESFKISPFAEVPCKTHVVRLSTEPGSPLHQ
jgi:hypothetical protein